MTVYANKKRYLIYAGLSIAAAAGTAYYGISDFSVYWWFLILCVLMVASAVYMIIMAGSFAEVSKGRFRLKLLKKYELAPDDIALVDWRYYDSRQKNSNCYINLKDESLIVVQSAVFGDSLQKVLMPFCEENGIEQLKPEEKDKIKSQ